MKHNDAFALHFISSRGQRHTVFKKRVSVSDWFRMTEGYSGSDLTSLAKDASLGPIRGETQSSSETLSALFIVCCLTLFLSSNSNWHSGLVTKLHSDMGTIGTV